MCAAPFLGILSLDTAFPRIVGDVGNPASYPFPARSWICEGADSPTIVRDGAPAPDLVAKFTEGARTLEAEGAGAIVSTCGFLVSLQREIAGAVRLPVLLSALSLAPAIQSIRPGRLGVLTASKRALGPAALAAAGLTPDGAAIAGLEDEPAFASVFLAPKAEQAPTLDRLAIERAVITRSRALLTANPDISAFLMECGNLPPYAETVRAATGCPVFHMLDAASWLMASLRGR